MCAPLGYRFIVGRGRIVFGVLLRVRNEREMNTDYRAITKPSAEGVRPCE